MKFERREIFNYYKDQQRLKRDQELLKKHGMGLFNLLIEMPDLIPFYEEISTSNTGTEDDWLNSIDVIMATINQGQSGPYGEKMQTDPTILEKLILLIMYAITANENLSQSLKERIIRKLYPNY